VKLLAILGWLSLHPQFVYVIIGYGMDLLVVLGVLTYSIAREDTSAKRWLLSGALVVPVASGIQQVPFEVLGVLDQNDIYHFVLSAAFVLLYVGLKNESGPRISPPDE
jgi:FtsH-binding integral membrane protein